MRRTEDIDDPTWDDVRDRDGEIERLRKQVDELCPDRVAWLIPPEMICGTIEEDLMVYIARLEHDRAVAQSRVARLSEWASEYGRTLCPCVGQADTYGEGVRHTKRQVARILSALPGIISDDEGTIRALREQVAENGPVQPGDPICVCSCPRCGAELDVIHGDMEGTIHTIIIEGPA